MAVYSLRTGAEDVKIDKVLEPLNGKGRADFIKKALYFYLDYKDTISSLDTKVTTIDSSMANMAANINKILTKLENGAAVIPQPSTDERLDNKGEPPTMSEAEMILFDSFQDILGIGQ